MADTRDQDTRWIARLTPAAGVDIERLLQMSLGLDVWQRTQGVLVVRAYEGRLEELERRGLADVERLYTEEEYLSENASGEEESQS